MLPQIIFRSFSYLNFIIFYTFRKLYVQTLYVRYFYKFRSHTFICNTLSFIRFDVTRYDVIRSVLIRSDVRHSVIMLIEFVRSTGESTVLQILQYM
jgi:hypothetical protein